jgi:hypothetical protein
MQLCISNQVRHLNCTIRRCDVSQISLLLTPQLSIASRHSATTFNAAITSPPQSINSTGLLRFQHSLYLTVQISRVDLLRCLHYPLSLGSPPMRHTSITVAPPLQYAVPRGGWFLLSQRHKTPIAGNSSFTDYAPGLSIKSTNYIQPSDSTTIITIG